MSLLQEIMKYSPVNEQEETGVRNAKLVIRDIFSLEILTVNGHVKKGSYVPSHLHFNVTYLAEADNHVSTTINHFYEKLFLLKDMMNTDTAKKLAMSREKYMKDYISEFLKEWDGCR